MSDMVQEIVINKRHGGFGVSLEAAKFMAERGNDYAREEIEKYESQDGRFADRWFGYFPDIERDDPDLVAAVKELGERADGEFSDLKVVEVPDGVEWEIEEYDGAEWVSESHRKWY